MLQALQYGFIQEALLVGTLVAVVCALLSCFLVLRGWSLMGDAVSHAVLPGIVLAYRAGLPLTAGAFVAGLFCAAATGWLRDHTRVREDTVMGVVFTGLFALGLVLLSRTETDLHLDHILFGSILGISPAQLRSTVTTCLIVTLIILLKRRDLMLLCFDPTQARVIGLPVRFLNYLLLALLATAIVVSIQTVGILLVVAMLITPGACAQLWTDRFDRMLAVAASSAVFSTVAGILISVRIDGSTASCIVLVQALIFAASLILAPKYGLIARKRARSAGGAEAGLTAE